MFYTHASDQTCHKVFRALDLLAVTIYIGFLYVSRNDNIHVPSQRITHNLPITPVAMASVKLLTLDVKNTVSGYPR